MKTAYLVLKDGRVFKGKPLGMIGETSGEVVFNTSLMGYQEILTDPSYSGQMITMTYPLIGNYGVSTEDVESRGVFAGGFIIREESSIASNFRSAQSLGDYLKEMGVVGVQGVDTRALTRHIREKGSMPGLISSVETDIGKLKEKAANLKALDGLDLVSRVTCNGAYKWNSGLWKLGSGFEPLKKPARFRVVALDMGIKTNILRNLVNIGCDVTVVPATMTAREILDFKPDGVFLSNGPGDPSAVPYAAKTVKELIGKKPIFGICLGHQILCLAMGAKTYKLKFGHHGGNQPVMDLSTRKVEITAQNHNFSVDPATLPSGMEVTHVNLNDKTVEGVRLMSAPVFSVQYHPEAGPGPHDSSYLFNRFADLMEASA
ncbi:MAG: glutamine-hydrolyzing carbamoyl-phosphate synthase small subunit [Nitrospinae bacterium]|nr:glutamine-hydrolyzing carbamoyl-phosphate synthase small subunit [Nitrospinota bacterium]